MADAMLYAMGISLDFFKTDRYTLKTKDKMKNAKLLIAPFLLGGFLALTACEGAITVHKDRATESTSSAVLTDLENNFLAVNYADIPVDTVVVGEFEKMVRLQNGTEITFDNNFRWTKINPKKGNIPAEVVKTELPVRLNTYLKNNYQDRPIRKIERKTRGYVVTLGKPSETLYFHRDGQLSNKVSKLPSNARVVLTKYFAADSMVSMILDDEQIYEVELTSGIEIDFDRTGYVDRVDVNKAELPAAFVSGFLPKMMTSYIHENYADRPIKKVIRKNYGYCVKLGKGGHEASVELRFSKDGHFLRNARQSESDDSEMM